MSRLPQIGGDDGVWGQILNDFLQQSLNADGTLKAAAAPVQSVNSKTGAVTLTASDVGAPTTLGALGDVNVAGATDTQVLAFDQTSSKWISSTVTSSVINDATSSAKGIIQLTGDLGGNAATPTVPGLASKESTANKGAANGYASLNSNTRVPSAQLGSGTADNTTFLRGDGSWVTPVGNVASVNGHTGTVNLAAADVGADASGAATTAQTNAEGYTDTQVATAPAFILYNTGGASYPFRSTVTSSATRVVIWIGPVAPAVGGNGAVDGVDVWWRTT